ncbi:MAG TPA: beta-ketoacyl-ACP reductase [Clostridiaceae bacterium]|nr:beta-ketoacyl-ACP reductase [Clostridiaceae bacterium]
MNLVNKVALITGSSSGIGEATARLFAKEGATVVLVARDIEKLKNIEKTINKSGGTALALQLDVSDSDQVINVVNSAIQKYGKIDILINNAGITRDSFIENMTVEMWDDVISVNLSGAFYMIHAVLPQMIKRKFGNIINMSSIAARRGAVTQANYSASKAGIIGLTLTLAQELGKKGITINAIAPGLVNTKMVEKIPEKIAEKWLKIIPVGRFATPEEIAHLCLYLVSEHGQYINGSVIDINGGLIG